MIELYAIRSEVTLRRGRGAGRHHHVLGREPVPRPRVEGGDGEERVDEVLRADGPVAPGLGALHRGLDRALGVRRELRLVPNEVHVHPARLEPLDGVAPRMGVLVHLEHGPQQIL